MCFQYIKESTMWNHRWHRSYRRYQNLRNVGWSRTSFITKIYKSGLKRQVIIRLGYRSLPVNVLWGLRYEPFPLACTFPGSLCSLFLMRFDPPSLIVIPRALFQGGVSRFIVAISAKQQQKLGIFQEKSQKLQLLTIFDTLLVTKSFFIY